MDLLQYLTAAPPPTTNNHITPLLWTRTKYPLSLIINSIHDHVLVHSHTYTYFKMSSSLDAGIAKDDGVHKNSTPGGSSNVNGGFRPSHTPGRSDNPMVNVQPPRREDLQPSYAQTLVGESDQGNHGWYGSMSMSQSSQVVRKEN